MRKPLLIALALACSAPAGAGTWDSDDHGDAARRQDQYDKAMDDGDQAAILAAGGATSGKRMKQLVNAAVRSYELAAEARPDAAEPHWRAGNVLYGFFIDCDGPGSAPLCTDKVDDKLYRRIIAHWDAFEAAAPLDPRVGDLLFDRAILHTKLATDKELAHAVRDYEAILDRDPDPDPNVLGNLAESYMMLGDLDSAIQRYQEAVQARQQTSVMYGLAVAYDRDGQGKKAREIVTALGTDAFQAWSEDVEGPDANTFYVPEGEVFYYYALAYEALGREREAIKSWKRYLDSGAHPRFQPRARDNLHALEQRAKRTK